MLPDYYHTDHATHYLRINQPDAPSPVEDALQAEKHVKLTLDEALQTARDRRKAQEQWLALEVKVPDHAPWAPHGYARLIEQLQQVEGVLQKKASALPVDELSALASALNAAINTMRPGNLPELEDLDPLLALLQRAKAVSTPSGSMEKAIEYAEMVVKYVADGSGTMDMIFKAQERLETLLK